MTQQRLNAVVVGHEHQEILDNLDIMKLAGEFASRSDIHRGLIWKLGANRSEIQKAALSVNFVTLLIFVILCCIESGNSPSIIL
jgi:hypothetical protein